MTLDKWIAEWVQDQTRRVQREAELLHEIADKLEEDAARYEAIKRDNEARKAEKANEG